MAAHESVDEDLVADGGVRDADGVGTVRAGHEVTFR
jgi:hypothetical protein